jgi:hypothetical protein
MNNFATNRAWAPPRFIIAGDWVTAIIEPPQSW